MRTVIQRTAICVILMAVLIDVDPQAFSQEIDEGQANFMANCAECHGTDGRGTGPRSAKLSTKPADLTLLAKKLRRIRSRRNISNT
jgi:mono/diheme cytochrome c family protein